MISLLKNYTAEAILRACSFLRGMRLADQAEAPELHENCSDTYLDTSIQENFKTCRNS